MAIHDRRYLTECVCTGRGLLAGFPVSTRNLRPSAAWRVPKSAATRRIPRIPVGNVANSRVLISSPPPFNQIMSVEGMEVLRSVGCRVVSIAGMRLNNGTCSAKQHVSYSHPVLSVVDCSG